MSAGPVASSLQYRIRRARRTPELRGLWDGLAWADAAALELAWFHSDSSDHRPRTQAKVLYDAAHLYVHFQVQDRYVRCVRNAHQTDTCRDSCVELFLAPPARQGYFNFEINCGGTMLLHYRAGLVHTKESAKQAKPVAFDWLDRIRVYHSLPRIVELEITDPVVWRLEYAVPWDLIRAYAGDVGPLPGSTWYGNFYKCASESSHPHWGAWQPVGQQRNFHEPKCFAPLVFEA